MKENFPIDRSNRERLPFQVKGKMTGQTLLPMPMGIERIFEAELKAQQNGDADVDVRLKSDIETIVSKWCSQIGDTLNEESTRALVNDKQPLPSAGTSRDATRRLQLMKIQKYYREICRFIESRFR